MTDENTTDVPDEQDATGTQERDDEHQQPDTGHGPVTTRRGVLVAGSVLGLLGLGAGTASADPSGQVGTSSDPLQDLYTETLHGHSGTLTLKDALNLDGNKLTSAQSINGSVTGNTEITDLVGSGLTINSGSLATSGSSKWTDGSQSSLLKPSDGSDTGIEGVTQLRSNDSLTVDIDADDSGSSATFTVQQDKDSGSATSLLTVNEGGDVDIDNGNLILGGNLDLGSNSVESSVFEVKTKHAPSSYSRVLELGAKTAASIRGDTGSATSLNIAGNVVAGHPNNEVQNDADGVVISGGGGDSGFKNVVAQNGGVVGGGVGNEAGEELATVAGGQNNAATGIVSTIPGGEENTADGKHSFAAGRKADTNTNDGAFVWGDSSSTAVTAGATDEVRFQATGGFVVENGNLDAQGGTVENTATESSLTIQNDTNDKTANSYEDLTLKTVDTGNNSYPGDIILDADPNNNDSRNISLQTGGTERATVNSNGLAVTSGSLDAQGGTVENTTGGLTVQTSGSSDDITLSPGGDVLTGGNLDFFQAHNIYGQGTETITIGNGTVGLPNINTTSSDDSLLAIDGSGNVKKASSTTLSDIGGKWTDGSNASRLKPSDSNDTEIEGVEKIVKSDNEMCRFADSEVVTLRAPTSTPTADFAPGFAFYLDTAGTDLKVHVDDGTNDGSFSVGTRLRTFK